MPSVAVLWFIRDFCFAFPITIPASFFSFSNILSGGANADWVNTRCDTLETSHGWYNWSTWTKFAHICCDCMLRWNVVWTKLQTFCALNLQVSHSITPAADGLSATSCFKTANGYVKRLFHCAQVFQGYPMKFFCNFTLRCCFSQHQYDIGQTAFALYFSAIEYIYTCFLGRDTNPTYPKRKKTRVIIAVFPLTPSLTQQSHVHILLKMNVDVFWRGSYHTSMHNRIYKIF